MAAQGELFDLWYQHASKRRRVTATSKSASNSTEHGHICFVEVRDDLPNGRGLALTQDVKPGQVILTLPSTLSFNVKTIDRYWVGGRSDVLPTPRRGSVSVQPNEGEVQLPLTSMQCLSLLLVSCSLYLGGARSAEQSPDALYDLVTFFRSLPQPADFASHPLVWVLTASEQDAGLLAALPPDALAAVHEEHDKFHQDWQIIQRIFTHQRHLLPTFLLDSSSTPTIQQYAHAWLCINTRSVYLNLNLTPHQDNFTMVPIFDMANHTSDARRVCEVVPVNAAGRPLVSRQGGGTALPAASVEMRASFANTSAGDEVLIQYGARDDGKLLAEYGFHLSSSVDGLNPGEGWNGNPYACLRLDRHLLSYLEGQSALPTIEDYLVQNNIWTDWTVHPHPSPPHPSWRTLCALRLVVALLLGTDADVRKWHLTLEGHLEEISEANSKGVDELLIHLCQAARNDLSRRLDGVRGDDGSARLVTSLLRSQIAIADGVIAISSDGRS